MVLPVAPPAPDKGPRKGGPLSGLRAPVILWKRTPPLFPREITALQGRAGRPRSQPPQNPSGKSAAHFALMRASSSRLARATTGKLSRRANGLHASITTRALRRSGLPSVYNGARGGLPQPRTMYTTAPGSPGGDHPQTNALFFVGA